MSRITGVTVALATAAAVLTGSTVGGAQPRRGATDGASCRGRSPAASSSRWPTATCCGCGPRENYRDGVGRRQDAATGAWGARTVVLRRKNLFCGDVDARTANGAVAVLAQCDRYGYSEDQAPTSSRAIWSADARDVVVVRARRARPTRSPASPPTARNAVWPLHQGYVTRTDGRLRARTTSTADGQEYTVTATITDAEQVSFLYGGSIGRRSLRRRARPAPATRTPTRQEVRTPRRLLGRRLRQRRLRHRLARRPLLACAARRRSPARTPPRRGPSPRSRPPTHPAWSRAAASASTSSAHPGIPLLAARLQQGAPRPGPALRPGRRRRWGAPRSRTTRARARCSLGRQLDRRGARRDRGRPEVRRPARRPDDAATASPGRRCGWASTSAGSPPTAATSPCRGAAAPRSSRPSGASSPCPLPVTGRCDVVVPDGPDGAVLLTARGRHGGWPTVLQHSTPDGWSTLSRTSLPTFAPDCVAGSLVELRPALPLRRLQQVEGLHRADRRARRHLDRTPLGVLNLGRPTHLRDYPPSMSRCTGAGRRAGDGSSSHDRRDRGRDSAGDVRSSHRRPSCHAPIEGGVELTLADGDLLRVWAADDGSHGRGAPSRRATGTWGPRLRRCCGARTWSCSDVDARTANGAVAVLAECDRYGYAEDERAGPVPRPLVARRASPGRRTRSTGDGYEEPGISPDGRQRGLADARRRTSPARPPGFATARRLDERGPGVQRHRHDHGRRAGVLPLRRVTSDEHVRGSSYSPAPATRSRPARRFRCPTTACDDTDFANVDADTALIGDDRRPGQAATVISRADAASPWAVTQIAPVDAPGLVSRPRDVSTSKFFTAPGLPLVALGSRTGASGAGAASTTRSPRRGDRRRTVHTSSAPGATWAEDLARRAARRARGRAADCGGRQRGAHHPRRAGLAGAPDGRAPTRAPHPTASYVAVPGPTSTHVISRELGVVTPAWPAHRVAATSHVPDGPRRQPCARSRQPGSRRWPTLLRAHHRRRHDPPRPVRRAARGRCSEAETGATTCRSTSTCAARRIDLGQVVRIVHRSGGWNVWVDALSDRARTRRTPPAVRPGAFVVLLVRAQPLRSLTFSVAAGRTVCRSPTTPKSTSSKIGASGSLLTATIVFDVCMPARCWIAPEMPLAT